MQKSYVNNAVDVGYFNQVDKNSICTMLLWQSGEREDVVREPFINQGQVSQKGGRDKKKGGQKEGGKKQPSKQKKKKEGAFKRKKKEGGKRARAKTREKSLKNTPFKPKIAF